MLLESRVFAASVNSYVREFIAYKETALPIVSAGVLGAFSPGARWPLPIRIGPLELAQQPVAALDGGVERGLRGFLAAKGLLQLVVDHIANQNERPEPDPPRIFRRRFHRPLLHRDRRAGIALVEALRAG